MAGPGCWPILLQPLLLLDEFGMDRWRLHCSYFVHMYERNRQCGWHCKPRCKYCVLQSDNWHDGDSRYRRAVSQLLRLPINELLHELHCSGTTNPVSSIAKALLGSVIKELGGDTHKILLETYLRCRVEKQGACSEQERKCGCPDPWMSGRSAPTDGMVQQTKVGNPTQPTHLGLSRNHV